MSVLTEPEVVLTTDLTQRVRRALEGVIGVPATEGNQIDVLRNGDEIFPAMFDAVEHAEHTIDFLTFIYWRGEGGSDLARLLFRRAKTGGGGRALPRTLGGDPLGPLFSQAYWGHRGVER